jgi:hypothetical protein
MRSLDVHTDIEPKSWLMFIHGKAAYNSVDSEVAHACLKGQRYVLFDSTPMLLRGF